jgi:cysteinyl-tRNA synthetase
MNFQSVPLRVFNTLTGKLETFVSLEEGGKPKAIRLYVCGPTVYDKAHLGHARCYITWDTLYRVLQFLEYPVIYVRNITDVDDKILAKARALQQSPKQLAAENHAFFTQDMVALNILPPHHEPCATAHIDDMITSIETLIEKGFAYVTQDGSVYFDVRQKKDYGKLKFSTNDPQKLASHLEDLQSGARVAVDEEKHSPLDFALWKAIPTEDPDGWVSPWPSATDGNTNKKNGWGRPGWHMECSAMNHAFFGEQIDIHAGGADLVFPHHENEIAQSECLTGVQPFARYWMHNGFVNVSGEKMSKSLGNFSTVRDVLARYDVNTIRYFLLTHHYRMPVDFTDEALTGAQNRIEKLSARLQEAVVCCNLDLNTLDNWLVTTLTGFKALQDKIKNRSIATSKGCEALASFETMLTAMASDDLNTAKALAELSTLLRLLKGTTDSEEMQDTLRLLLSLLNLSGFNLLLLLTPKACLLDEHAIYQLYQTLFKNQEPPEREAKAVLRILLTERQQAKQAKNWERADAIRKALVDLNFQLLDSKEGTTQLAQNGIEVVGVC